MKVLDIIVEGAAGEFAWKFFTKQTAKDVFAQDLAERLAVKMFNQYTTKLKRVPEGAVESEIATALKGTAYETDAKFAKQLASETKRYHDKELLTPWRKSNAPKEKEETVPKEKEAQSSSVVKATAKEARIKWKAWGTKGLISNIFWMYTLYDIWKAVDLYWRQIDWALGRLELGPDDVDEDGKPGIDLDAFELYHKEKLGALLISIAAIRPGWWSKIPVLGWMAAPFKMLGVAGQGLWFAFMDIPGLLPEQSSEESIREIIARWACTKIKDIPWLPGASGESIASTLGAPVKWSIDAVKNAWTEYVREYYGDEEPPSSLLPTILPDNSAHPSSKKRKKDQAAAVTPADADQNADTSPTNNATTGSRTGNWRNMGNGYELNLDTGDIQVKRLR
jgi:hypothetical protein